MRWEKQEITPEFFKAVGMILVKANSVSGMPQQEPETLKAQAMAWAEILCGQVPEKRLYDCYLLAMRSRNSSYPLNASELCEAWRQIQVSELHQPKQICQTCTGQGFVYTQERALKPCPECKKK